MIIFAFLPCDFQGHGGEGRMKERNMNDEYRVVKVAYERYDGIED